MRELRPVGRVGRVGRAGGGGAGEAFDPLDRDDLVYFLRSGPTWQFTDGGLTTPAGDTDLVHAWVDQSDTGAQTDQASESVRPTLRAVSGGRWETEFEGTNDLMANGGLAVNQPLTAYVRVNSHTGGGYFFYSHTNVVAMGWNVALGSDYSLYAGASGCSVVTGRIGAVPGTFTGVLNGASSVLYLDGVQIAAGDAGSNNLGPGITIGNFPGQGQPVEADVVAILIFNTAHDAATRAQVEAYLGTL